MMPEMTNERRDIFEFPKNSCPPSPTTPFLHGKQGDGLHWLPHVERKGVLGNLVVRANHYAITVSDVAK
jgi:hypothetical protein